MKPNAVFLLFFVGITSFSCMETSRDIPKKTRPNIVFIMADDHAYQAIGAYDDKLIKTPNIDRIANEGLRFVNASVTNSICAPSRAVILTGKHSHLNGKIDNRMPFDTTNVTFPQLLQQSGYQTAMFGKLHFGNNPKGFDEFKILPGQGDYYNPKFITSKGDTTVTGYVTDIITDFTLDWLEKRRDTAKPFLLMYLHKAPHRPWIPAERHYKEFTKKTFPVPETLFDNYNTRGNAAKTAEMGILKDMQFRYDNKVTKDIATELELEDRYNLSPLHKMNQAQRASWDSVYRPISESFKEAYPKMNDSSLTVWKYQRYMQDYLATIAAVDENVGRLLDYLDQNRLNENTVVVYTSDQGFYLGEHGWFDKRFAYEESFKTPLLIRWPNIIKPGITEDEMVQNLDFAQTFLEIAGITPPQDMQGESLMPLLTGGKREWIRNGVYYHYYEYPSEHAVKRHYAMATKDFKLIHFYFDVDEWELYDRKKDPNELNNVYDDPDYAEIRSQLKKELRELREKYKDSDELSQSYIQIYRENGWIK
ncbi:sulfatase [Maribacter sp. 2304DJ31-5]|uniref:sulfatase family protein n=1 Tax=Maribacter sp. 2304DJ31-5 TaxID=3386273 RepID=UPI0039BC3F0F